VPGGIVDQPRGSPRTLDWIRRTAATAELVTSVCTGAFLLAEAGLLDGLRATTHWEDAADLRREFPAVDVVDDQFWVDRGRVVTSAGIAAGIDMCLHLVARLQDEDFARTAARQMVYDWRPGPAGVVAGELEQAQATGGVVHEAAVQRRRVPRAGPEGSGRDGRAGHRSPARVRSQQHLLADRGR
jgi:transcriptional regulator GlxA family with amidase domain